MGLLDLAFYYSFALEALLLDWHWGLFYQAFLLQIFVIHLGFMRLVRDLLDPFQPLLAAVQLEFIDISLDAQRVLRDFVVFVVDVNLVTEGFGHAFKRQNPLVFNRVVQALFLLLFFLLKRSLLVHIRL